MFSPFVIAVVKHVITLSFAIMYPTSKILVEVELVLVSGVEELQGHVFAPAWGNGRVTIAFKHRN